MQWAHGTIQPHIRVKEIDNESIIGIIYIYIVQS